MLTSPFPPLKGTLISPPPPTWHQSLKSQSFAERHISNIFGSHFLLHSGVAVGHAKLLAQRERGKDGGRQGVSFAANDVCNLSTDWGKKRQTNALRHHSFSWKYIYELVCVCLFITVCAISSGVLQPSFLAAGLLDTRAPWSAPNLHPTATDVLSGMALVHSAGQMFTHMQTMRHTDGNVSCTGLKLCSQNPIQQRYSTDAISSLSLLQSCLLASYGLYTPTIC